MKYLLPLLILTLAACAQREPAAPPLTLDQWRDNHPYAKPTLATNVDGGLVAHQYTDKVPRIDFVGTSSVHTETTYTYSLLVDANGGIVSEHVMRGK
jgi:hypothetical protein